MDPYASVRGHPRNRKWLGQEQSNQSTQKPGVYGVHAELQTWVNNHLQLLGCTSKKEDNSQTRKKIPVHNCHHLQQLGGFGIIATLLAESSTAMVKQVAPVLVKPRGLATPKCFCQTEKIMWLIKTIMNHPFGNGRQTTYLW
jgi:hypothetical protein